MTATPGSAFLSSQGVTEAHKLIGILSEKLMDRKLVMATAESCTGGLMAALCTDMAGSSGWFCGSVVAYDNKVKSACLGVDERVLARFGAVSEEVVRQMALGALQRLPAQCAVAVSGIAGPDGGTPEKPVGTVWLAVSLPGKESEEESKDAPPLIFAERHQFAGSRSEVRLAAAIAGFSLLLEKLR